ncbi:NAD(P)/FAD-dependent oxidoreductase [Sneathiella chinensis]|uniref:Glycerol-3-phosphate dehydrogenase n=1 Tax=Sneathiella chinensis TaxID=349750 RepID=A0ABQ5U165_9PROT|nr:FAD-binding oxidoreductase [Sneathiella chinensis]GLQ05910.1 glycerol-3-phosphate dehydrogenase [Sneathiella chinensis]
MTTGTDILIIGGGIAGISAAARLSGEASVTVLEAEPTISYHSTGRTAAIYLKNYGNQTLRALNRASEPFFLEPEGVSDHSILSPRGELHFAHEDEVESLDAYLEGSDGMERITPREAVEMVPILREDLIVAAAYESAAQDIDVDRLLQGFARMVRSNKGQIVTNARVQTLTRENGEWVAETPAGTFKAPIVINAAGAWADAIATLAGVKTVGLVPKRRSGILLPAPEGYDITHWPLFITGAERWYGKPEAGKLMISPADEDPVEPHDAWPDDMVVAEGLHRFETATTVEVTRVEHSWAGLRNFVKDRSPVVGFAPDADGFFWLAGQGGYGIQTSPALSQLTADLCLGKSSPLPQNIISALNPERLFS